MNFIGRVDKHDDYFVPGLYECYEKRNGPGTPEWNHAHQNIKVKRACLRIHLIGVWDTVGTLGAPGFRGQIFNWNKYEYHNVDLSDAVENAFHALALDESRKPFQSTLWNGPAGRNGVLEQAGFCGVHSNVGGGC